MSEPDGTMDQRFFDRLSEAREKHERVARRVRSSLLDRLHALGMLADTPLGASAIEREFA